MENHLFGRKISLFFFLGIICLSIFFRTWKIKEIPPGLWGDEAVNANEGIRLIENYEIQIFFGNSDGKESLFLYFVGITSKLFGENKPWAARLASVFFGILTVIGVFLLTTELFDRDIGLLAAYFMAVSFWHTVFSRIAFRAIMVPAVNCFALYFLIIAIKKAKLIQFAIAGLIFGLGFYTYFSFLSMPFIIFFSLPFLILFLRDYFGFSRMIKKGIALFSLTALVVALPMLLYINQNFEIYMARGSYVSVFSFDSPGKRLFWNFWKTMLMFTFEGDKIARHNIPGRPQLSLPVGILFWIGFLYMILILLHHLRKKDFRKVAPTFLTLSLWGGMLLPAVISTGTPHALRSLGTVVPTYIMAAFGLKMLAVSTFAFFKGKPIGNLLVKGSLTSLLLLIGLINYQDYFVNYRNHPDVNNAFLSKYVSATEYLIEIPSDVQKYILINTSNTVEQTLITQTIHFITPENADLNIINWRDISSIDVEKHESIVIASPFYVSDLKSILSNQIHVDLIEQFNKDGFYILYNGTDN